MMDCQEIHNSVTISKYYANIVDSEGYSRKIQNQIPNLKLNQVTYLSLVSDFLIPMTEILDDIQDLDRLSNQMTGSKQLACQQKLEIINSQNYTSYSATTTSDCMTSSQLNDYATNKNTCNLSSTTILKIYPKVHIKFSYEYLQNAIYSIVNEDPEHIFNLEFSVYWSRFFGE